MDNVNPYQSPESCETRERKRRPSWTGTAVIVLAVAIYGPMTFTPLFHAISGKDSGLMFLAFCVNGAVFCGLLWLGRWLRRRTQS